MTGEAARTVPHRFATEPETVERELARLALTIVELLRQLMERQAVRRVEQGDLTADEEERIGMTLMRLDDRMAHLLDRFGLARQELNLDLGPLGTLLPRDGDHVHANEAETDLERASGGRPDGPCWLCQRRLLGPSIE